MIFIYSLDEYLYFSNCLGCTGMFTSLQSDNILQSALKLIPKDPELESLVKKEIETMMVCKDGEILAIFYGSSMTAESEIERPNEKGMLYLLLNYLALKIESTDTSKIENIFSLSDEEREKMKIIFEILKQWLVDLILVDSIRKCSKPEKYIDNYAIVLMERLKCLDDIYIIPSGFAKAEYHRVSYPNFPILEVQYIGPYSMACIVESESKEYKKITQIDPISPYHRSYRDLTRDRINLGLEITKIPWTNFDVNFLSQLLTLRIIQGKENYKSARLYEVVLSKLGGEGHIKNEIEHFIDLDEKGFFSFSWTVVKNVLYYLLKKFFRSPEMESLYVKVNYEFQFKLLINTFDKFRKLENNDRLDSLKHQFLLHEICNKIAHGTANSDGIRKEVVVDYILMIQQSIHNQNQKYNDGQQSERYIQKLMFQHNSFKQFLPENLEDLKFIKGNITSNLNFSLGDTVRKQFSFHMIDFENVKSSERILKLNRMLDDITLEYGFNRVIQISQLIEDVIFSIVQKSDFKGWCSNQSSSSELAFILLRMANTYYNCSAIITSKLHPDLNCIYEPIYYTKLVLILFSLFAMIEDLARNDSKIGPNLKDYTISTEWKKLSLQQVIPQLSLPERKWLELIKKLKAFFQLSSTNLQNHKAQNNCLFHDSSLWIGNEADKSNTDVIFTLKVLRNSFTANFTRFEETLRKTQFNELSKKWKELLFSDKYLPDLLRHLREVARLSQLSLIGFPLKSIEQIVGISSQTNMYNRFLCNRDDFDGIYSLRIGYWSPNNDKERFTDFVLPKEQEKYQKMIVFGRDKQGESNVFENQIISTQNEKPDKLTRPQYHRLCSMQRDDELKFTFLYIALKNHEITFEIEEHCYLIKQCLYKLGTHSDNSMLEKQFQNEHFASALVRKFIEITLDLRERITQYKSIGHALDILIYLYDYCSSNIKSLIDNCLKELRITLFKNINEDTSGSILNDNQTVASILSCYYILTFKNPNTIDANEVSNILRLRIRIEIHSKLYSMIPYSLYIKTMTTLFKLSSKIENILDKNSKMLNSYIESSSGSWKKDTTMNLYVKDFYSFATLKGRLFQNNHPISGLPSGILNHSCYKECFGTQNFSVKVTNRNIFGQTLRCYEIKTKESTNIRLSLLSNNQIWIESDDQTFISKTHLNKLPKFLLENSTHLEKDRFTYSHWYKDNKIFIKDVDKIVKYEIDLTDNEIYSNEHQKFLVPFTKDQFDRSNELYKTFSRFEDGNYILVLKNRKEDNEPVMIYLPRLNLKFKIQDQKIVSEDFKDYRLSKNQHMNTLNGLSQYLIIEPDVENDNLMKFNRKIIIPYHPIVGRKSIFSNVIQFNFGIVGKPAYFSYEIDENLECLNSETTAGSLYLALLYFKTATLDKDLFFKMNGYEICSEILKTCWQNCPYTDIEFNIILKFFDNRCPDLDKPWSNYAGSEESMFRIAIEGSYVHHPNARAIFIRLIHLLFSSYQTDFLMQNDVNKLNLYGYFLKKQFVNYHFNFYLIHKHLISKRCRLSIEEEKRILSSCVADHSQSRLSDYYNAIEEKKTFQQLVSNVPRDYKRLEHLFFSKNSLKQLEFEKKVKKFFSDKLSSCYNSFRNKTYPISRFFSDWVSTKFEFSYFICLYRIVLNIDKNNDFTKANFFYLLTYLFLSTYYDDDALYHGSQDEYSRIFLSILYMVSIFPKEFHDLPQFLLSESNDISDDSSYGFHCDSMKFIKSDIPTISNNSSFNEQLNYSIWSVIKSQYLKHDGEFINTVTDMMKTAFKEKFQNNIETILKQKKIFDITSQVPNNVYTSFITKGKNKELYDFFIDIAKQCDKLVKSNPDKIGYTVIETASLSNFNLSLSSEDIEKKIYNNYSYSKNSDNSAFNLEWKVKSIDINQHYEILNKYFDIKSYYPEKISFPLDHQTVPENSLVHKFFSTGYGKTFVSDLEDSYGQQLSIVKIDDKYLFYSMKESKKAIDILKDLGFDYRKEFSDLENNLNEIMDDLLTDVENWMQHTESDKYNIQNEREKLENLKIELQDTCENINKKLIKQKVLSESLEVKALKTLLENLKSDSNFKKDARNWLRELEDAETEIEDFIVQNNDLLKLYLNYCCEQSFVSPLVLKFICKRNKISISVYEKLDTTIFELKLIEKYTYTNSECTKEIQFCFNGETFSLIETKTIQDEKTLEKLNIKSNVVGYLQTPTNEILLKSGYDINKITNVLLEYYSKYEKINVELLEEIYHNIDLIVNFSENASTFILHRIMGEKPAPTKKEILCLLKDIDKIEEWNPFIVNHKEKFYEKIESYLVQEILIQQIQRVILLITKYNSLDSKIYKDEKYRMRENIFTNILMERSYDKSIYPSWLLFEIENNLLIRNTQYCLIKAMTEEKDNSIYQLNMGEGKTSVILIILSEMLANGEQIARINCLESLMGVMQELLRNKFRGLLQKKIYVMPFSRDVVFSIENLGKIKEMLTDCQNGKHILLVTPEQRLCFQLKKQEMFLEYLQSKDANDCFDWKEHSCRTYVQPIHSSEPYELTHGQNALKETLKSLGYIDDKNKIVKFPSEGFNKFGDEVHNKANQKAIHGVYSAYDILRDQSTQLKTQRQQKLDLLYMIDEFKFFDILDESDEILRHGKELNYTLGLAKPLDGGSLRWKIPFLIFKIIFYENDFGTFLENASKLGDCPVVYQQNFRPISGIGGGSPLVRFIKHEYFIEIIKPKICEKLCNTLLSRFQQKKTDILDDKGVNYGSYKDFIEGKCFFNEQKIIPLLKENSQDMLTCFLLAKAWLSHELLYHVMSYRYRVEYGLSEKKEKEIAIPFRGKDLPSENSEFSHPDIMIGFTILSYLYRGLDMTQVKNGLIKLKSDPKENVDNVLKQLVEENKQWIEEQIKKENEKFPDWLNSFKTFDLENENRIKKAHFYLSRNFTLIQYYLTNFTFPNDTKYYEKKLTGNAHSLAGEGKTNGFSGTDDRNDTMPESVVSKRLASQVGTNGKMLHILSRKVNQKYETNEAISTKHFLDQVCKYVQYNKDCYIFIDSGAMITEMSNLDVSKYLIKNIDKRFDGIVYFSDKTNKIMVILKNEESLPLSACHIDNKKLFVYLDEVHTRGTDLKLPLTANGIVTLGKSMNKDKLMQAVMRLRDLDFKQSVVLWGSKEISAEIAIINGINLSSIISKHVLTWVTYNTIRKNEGDLYLVMKEKLKYVIKGRALEYQKRVKEIPMTSLIEAYVSKSEDSIEKSYGTTPQERNPKDVLNRNMAAYLTGFYPLLKRELKEKKQSQELNIEFERNENEVDRPKMENMIKRIKEKLPKSILTVNTDMNNEQENEREIEEMQRIEVVPEPDKVPISEVSWQFEDVFSKNFLEKALTEESGSPKLKELKKCFEFTDIDGLGKLIWHGKVFVTDNFTKTIGKLDDRNKQYQNECLKPVNMILTLRNNEAVYFIVISTFEAQNLAKLCYVKQNSKVAVVHIDDVNGPTMVPQNGAVVSKDEMNNIIAIIRLFNGDSHYSNEEIAVIKKSVAFVERDYFHQDKIKSGQMYSELESRHYLTNGFMTYRLTNKLGDESQKILPEIEAKLGINLHSRLRGIVKESIAEDPDIASRLPGIIRQLIQIRGKSMQYERSTLKEIFDKREQ